MQAGDDQVIIIEGGKRGLKDTFLEVWYYGD